MPKKPAPMVHRMMATARAHPAVTLGTLASLGGLLAVGGQFALWGWGFVESAPHAREVEKELRAEIALLATKAELAAARIDFEGLKRSLAWNTVQLVGLQATTSRNRLNDCDIKHDKGASMSALERQACAQYQQEFDDATRRYNDARAAAQAIR